MSSDENSTTSSQSSPTNDAVGSKEQPENTSEASADNEKTDAVEVTQAVAVAVAAEAAPKPFRFARVNQKGTKSSSNNKPVVGNELSHIIPGYTAPMRLEAKSLKGITGASLAQLRNRAARGDSTTYSPSISILNRQEEAFDPAAAAKKVKTPSSIALQKRLGGGGKIPTSFSSSFRKGPKKAQDNSAGSGWFGMNPTAMTDQLKTDLSIIRNRNYLDPKKFYKSAESFEGKVLQVGTVIEGSSEFYSSRIVNRDRRQNLTEEIMADPTVAHYAKRKNHDLQMERAKPMRKMSRKGKKRGS
eukprot:CAMPEP_0201928050 /NCGR_PEP_ID=MMETSP0903-20130614/20054_1 /ASSEMBLY_ACC=CAM_ASM_000552 /TAXON_ID=420261 /ORGANISM="Thalassiosira antarctica, Strain CCMP982" /LENGTH=300 /DNA_ID=CAMNT_0048466409 /DNA_START=43 /DNA_END=942 /DNA_ORIENTATION=-